MLQEMEFDWDEKTQGLILSAFFWGYVITQMPGGMLADKYGGKATLGLGMLFSSIGTVITPVVARIGPVMLIILRLIIGLAQVCILLETYANALSFIVYLQSYSNKNIFIIIVSLG